MRELVKLFFVLVSINHKYGSVSGFLPYSAVTSFNSQKSQQYTLGCCNRRQNLYWHKEGM